MKELTFVSGNDVKAEQLRRHLPITILREKVDLPEIQSLDVLEVVADKALRAYEILKCPVLVEDFSMQLKGLNGFPGPLLKWFTSSLSGAEICKMLDGKSRAAIAQIGVAICDESGVQTFLGEHVGKVALRPRVTGSFMFESLFIPFGSEQTWSEMTVEDKIKFSVRARAYDKLKMYLETR